MGVRACECTCMCVLCVCKCCLVCCVYKCMCECFLCECVYDSGKMCVCEYIGVRLNYCVF